MSCHDRFCQESSYNVTVSNHEGHPLMNGQLFPVQASHCLCSLSGVEAKGHTEESNPNTADRTQQTQQTQRPVTDDSLLHTSTASEAISNEEFRLDPVQSQPGPSPSDLDGIFLVQHHLRPLPVDYPIFPETESDPHLPYYSSIDQYERQPRQQDPWTPVNQHELLIEEETEHRPVERNAYGLANGESSHETDDAESGNENDLYENDWYEEVNVTSH